MPLATHVFGVVDPRGYLRENEVFVQVRKRGERAGTGEREGAGEGMEKREQGARGERGGREKAKRRGEGYLKFYAA